MEFQTTLESEVVEYETISDEKEEFLNDDDEPCDLADQYYEEWRDEKRSREESER
jgi:hypothetical protein